MPRPKAAALIAADPERGVRITSPGLEDTPERETILRGSLAVESLPLLKVDHTYQRELLRPSTNRDIQRAIDMGVDLPDLTLGMRGDRFTMDTTGAVWLAPENGGAVCQRSQDHHALRRRRAADQPSQQEVIPTTQPGAHDHA